MYIYRAGLKKREESHFAANFGKVIRNCESYRPT